MCATSAKKPSPYLGLWLRSCKGVDFLKYTICTVKKKITIGHRNLSKGFVPQPFHFPLKKQVLSMVGS